MDYEKEYSHRNRNVAIDQASAQGPYEPLILYLLPCGLLMVSLLVRKSHSPTLSFLSFGQERCPFCLHSFKESSRGFFQMQFTTQKIFCSYQKSFFLSKRLCIRGSICTNFTYQETLELGSKKVLHKYCITCSFNEVIDIFQHSSNTIFLNVKLHVQITPSLIFFLLIVSLSKYLSIEPYIQQASTVISYIRF